MRAGFVSTVVCGPSCRKSRTSSPTRATQTAGPKNAVRQPKCASSHAASAVATSGPTWKQVDQKPITAPRSVGPYQAAIALTFPGQPVAWTKPLRPKKSANRDAVLDAPKAAISSADRIIPYPISRREPIRSPSHPPANWPIAYVAR